MISGGMELKANSAAQVNTSSGGWAEVIAPASNTGGIYLARVTIWGEDPAFNQTVKAHTAPPAGGGDGVTLALIKGTQEARPDIIVPPGQGLYVNCSAPIQLFFRVL